MVKTYQTFTIEKEAMDRAREICKEYGFNMSAVVTNLLKEWTKRIDKVFGDNKEEDKPKKS